MKSVILFGEPATEETRADETDTLVQVRFVVEQLRMLGHRVAELPLGLDLDATRKELVRRQPDVVFNLVESVGGRGDLIHLAPMLLEMLAMPFTGAPQAAMYLTSNKLLAKRQMTLAGLPTPPLWEPGAPHSHATWIVKSVWEHASLGMDERSVVGVDGVGAALVRQRARFGGEWFAEAFVAGREFNLSLLELPDGPMVLPPAEIDFSAFPSDKPHIVDYAAKWDEASFAYHHTPRRFEFAPTDKALVKQLKDLALTCWALFDLRGYTRVDFRVDYRGRPWILEVNANPCLSPDAGFMVAAERGGFTSVDVVEHLIAAATRDEANARVSTPCS